MTAMARVARHVGLSLKVERDHCCGALAHHLGRDDEERAAPTARGRTLVAINSGCMAQWQRVYAAQAISGIATWLDALCAQHADRLVAKPMRIALHLPCTQQAHPAEVTAMRRLVGRLPGALLIELPQQPGCCGAGGTYFLNQPAIAQALAATMSGQIQSTRPDIVLSANGACRAQLAQAMFDAGSDIRVLHPAELVAEYLDEPTQ